jgi:hypothetical protein
MLLQRIRACKGGGLARAPSCAGRAARRGCGGCGSGRGSARHAPVVSRGRCGSGGCGPAGAVAWPARRLALAARHAVAPADAGLEGGVPAMRPSSPGDVVAPVDAGLQGRWPGARRLALAVRHAVAPADAGLQGRWPGPRAVLRWPRGTPWLRRMRVWKGECPPCARRLQGTLWLRRIRACKGGGLARAPSCAGRAARRGCGGCGSGRGSARHAPVVSRGRCGSGGCGPAGAVAWPARRLALAARHGRLRPQARRGAPVALGVGSARAQSSPRPLRRGAGRRGLRAPSCGGAADGAPARQPGAASGPGPA